MLSVILPIYKQCKTNQFVDALNTIICQTQLPQELLIVADGPIPDELEEEVTNYQLEVSRKGLPIEVSFLQLEDHGGLGMAMQKAVDAVKGDYIARMDADDICLPDRFEKQMKCFEENPELSVVGGQIAEFDGNVTNITGRRVVPLEHEDIVNYMKSRNGMNHVTTIIKKKDLIAAGNYQPFEWFEDYSLWVRMIQHGCRFKNIADDVVYVRAGKAQADRRGGWAYFRKEVSLFKCFLNQGFISRWRFIRNLFQRGVVRVLMTSSVRNLFYKNVLRKM